MDLILFGAGLAGFLILLVLLGLAEPEVNRLMGWTDEHRDADHRNHR